MPLHLYEYLCASLSSISQWCRAEEDPSSTSIWLLVFQLYFDSHKNKKNAIVGLEIS